MKTTRPQHRKHTQVKGVYDVIMRQRAEQRLRAANAALKQRAAQLQALAVELTQAEQRERRRLAQLLHDHLQQLLVGARLRLGVLCRRNQDETVARAAAQVDEIIEQCLDESRSLTADLSPPVLYEGGLAAALEWLGDQMQRRYGLTTAVEADRQAEPADESVRVLLFQAVQELLFNVVKHAHVDRAQVTMTKTVNHETRIEVFDAGLGFDAAQIEARTTPNGGFGLFSIRQRMAILAGHVEITGEPGRGTRAVIHVPLGQPGHRNGHLVGHRPKAMKRADRSKDATQRKRTAAQTPDGNGNACVALASDAPPFHCPSCKRPVPEAPEDAEKHERFLKRLFEREEAFQQSLASAIHDGLAQQLAGALLYFEAPRQLRDGPMNDAQDGFRIGLQLLRDGIHEARQIAGRLQPPNLSDHGIVLGIEYLIHELQNHGRGGPKIVFLVKGELSRAAPELKNAVFRIVRELLVNACRHSKSDAIRLTVTRTSNRLRLDIEDWGVGFDSEKVNGNAFGLQEVQQRAKLLGGAVIVDSVPGKGTRVVVSFPIHDMPPAEIAASHISGS